MRPSLYPPAPSTCSAVRFTRAVPIALSLGCLGSLAAGQHRERNVPSCPGCRSTWAGAPAYGGLVLCLCATLTIATDVAGTRRFRHVSHVSKPSLSRGSIAKRESRDPGASAVEQARYSSELRTDGAGSVTLSGCHWLRACSHCGHRGFVRPQHQPRLDTSNRREQTVTSHSAVYCHRKLGNQKLWIPTKPNVADDVDCRFLMSRSLEAYLPADKANRAMLAAAICVFLRTAAYRRVLMRMMRGICSI